MTFSETTTAAAAAPERHDYEAGHDGVATTALIEVVQSLTASLAPMVEQSCLTLCHEIGAMGNALAVAEARQRMVVALQFQDRHTQAVQDIGVLLGHVRMAALSGERTPLDKVCNGLQLGESRALLRAAASGHYQRGICIMRGAEPGAVDLF